MGGGWVGSDVWDQDPKKRFFLTPSLRMLLHFWSKHDEPCTISLITQHKTEKEQINKSFHHFHNSIQEIVGISCKLGILPIFQAARKTAEENSQNNIGYIVGCNTVYCNHSTSCLLPMNLPPYPMMEHHVVIEYVLGKGQFASTKASQFKSSSIASWLNKHRYLRIVKPS